MLKEAIQELAGTRNQDEVKLYQAIVNSVDIEKRNCNVTTVTGNATLTFDAMLTAGVSDGIIVIPQVDSFVFVLKSKYTIPFVVLYSDIEKLVLKGGEFGGFVKVIELTQKINNLENKVNELITIFNAHSHSALNVPTSSIISSQLIPTERAEIENQNITHGAD
ncbi:MAG: hypothetical protein H7296_04545 [Bacteroidia bacterium]|nr:hypothetical protein [Bacteroidia bacterium]